MTKREAERLRAERDAAIEVAAVWRARYHSEGRARWQSDAVHRQLVLGQVGRRAGRREEAHTDG